MKLKAINCENMGAILVHKIKPKGAPTDLVAEVHSGFEDAKHIAECVNAAAVKSDAWPEDVAENLDPTAIQGGVVGSQSKRIEMALRVCEGIETSDLENNFSGAGFFGKMAGRLCIEKRALSRKLSAVESQRDELMAALEYCRSVFDEYISLHLDKSPPDYDKAASNEKHRAACDAAIASVKGGAE